MENERQSPRLLVVEDEYLVAEMLKGALEDLEIHVIGPAHSIDEGLRLVESEKIDGAILDVNLGGKYIDPVVDALKEKNVPFAIATGYHGDILKRWSGTPILPKPYSDRDVATVVARLGFGPEHR